MVVLSDSPARGPVTELLREHLADMALHSPPESIHALDVGALLAPGISFWTVNADTELLGCGALSVLDERHGEIKSMRTRPAYRGQGVATLLLRHILDEARQRGLARLSLETGAAPAFAPARALYARFGFSYCGPFAGYVLDPHSVFMTLEICSARGPTRGLEPTQGSR